MSAASTADDHPHRASRDTDGECFDPGTRLGRYEVIELLGAGSMGRVYRVCDTDLSRQIALKRINPGRWRLASAQTRLRREAQAMARVEHAAVIRVYDILIAAGELFVAMELARGGTLLAWMEAKPRAWREVMRVFLEAGRGLAAAHHVGLVHRDVKPSNILLDAHDRAKVSDFGLAHTLDAPEAAHDSVEIRDTADGATQTGTIAGTLPYMAPEQLVGHPVDARADQFSFCVALWEALAGRRPFYVAPGAAATPQAFLQPILAGAITAPEHGARVPRRVLARVRRGLAADRQQRWRSMDDLLDALEQAMRPLVLGWIVLVIGVVIGVVIAAALLLDAARSGSSVRSMTCGNGDQLTTVWNPGARQRYLAAADPSAAEDAGWFEWYAHALTEAYATSCERSNPEPMKIACLDDALEELRTAVTRQDRRYWPRLRAIDRCGTQMHESPARGTLLTYQNFRLSPDGKWLLVLDDNRPPAVMELATDRRYPLELTSAIRWLPDGRVIGRDDQDRIAIVDPPTHHAIERLWHWVTAAGTPEPQRIRPSTPLPGRLVDVSDDLLQAAVVQGDRLVIVRIPDGAQLAEPVVTGADLLAQGAFSPDGRRFAMLVSINETTARRGASKIYIDDLGARSRVVLEPRLQWRATGGSELRWLDPTSFILTGSATDDIAGDLWRVRVDRSGQVSEPPQILVYSSESQTVMYAQDAQADKLLIQRLRIFEQGWMFDDRESSPSPLLRWTLSPAAVDRAKQRLLVATDPSLSHWAWVALDGSNLDRLDALDGLHDATAGPEGIAALDLRADPPAYVALDEFGTVTFRLPITAARGATPTLRCGTSRCVVMWASENATVTATIEGRTVGAPTRRSADLSLDLRRWQLSPDGRSMAAPTYPRSNRAVVYDLDRAIARSAITDTCKIVHAIRFLPGGDLALHCLSPISTKTPHALIRRDPAGHERVLALTGARIPWFLPIDDHRILADMIAYDSGLSIFEQ